MAKKGSEFGSFGSFGARPFGAKSPKARKQEAPPAPRNYEGEEAFCAAIKRRVSVSFRYDGETFERVFDPDAVFRSSKDKVLVEGTLVENPEDPRENGKFRTFEVGKVRSVGLTNRSFVPNQINRFDERYRDGIICPI